MDFTKLCGWIYDEQGIKQYASKVGRMSDYRLTVGNDQKDVFLWLPLLEVKPTWKRGAQGIGDCVSWGGELAETMLLAIQSKNGVSEWIEEVATESNYGGCRVEVFGKKSGGWSDGAMGYAMADFAKKFGVILRLDYSKETGNSEHDLRVYDSEKAKNWGNYGCGGQNDKEMLDNIARKYPVKGVAQVNTIEDCIVAISNGYPITIASSAGFGSMRRDKDGVVRRSGSWNHQMMLGGLRWVNGKVQFRMFQSWGNSCGTDNDPGITHPEVSKCSWWATEEDILWILKNGDCWAFADAEGFPPRKLDFLSAFKTWG